MEEITRLDKVSIYDNSVSFLIPREWIETLEDDHYLYHHPETESGWLRVTLIKRRTGDEPPNERLNQLFVGKENVIVEPQSGNLVSISQKDSEESGLRIHHYYWMVANVVSTDAIYEAVFSYTILQERMNDEGIKRAVSIIGQLVSRAEFNVST